MPLILFNPYIGPYQVLPRWAKVDLGAMTMKGCSAFPEDPALPEPHHQIVKCISRTLMGKGVLPLCRSAVSVFYSPNRLGKVDIVICCISCKNIQSMKQTLESSD